jgi:hypothetical protein
VLLAALAFATAAGCGSITTAPDGSSDGAADGPADSGAPCNAVEQLGAQVAASCTDGGAPEVTGGTIADGTYVLTSATYYGTCVTSVLAETVVVTGGSTIDSVVTFSNGTVERNNLTYSVAGTDLQQMHMCPLSDSTTTPFSATPSTLSVSLTVDNATRVSVYTRQ